MGEPPSAAGLVAPSSGVLLAAPSSLCAVAGTVDLAAVATATDHSLGATIRAKKQSSRRRVTVFRPANAKWTNATIARIMPLHACPARCRARRRGETAKLGSAPCLPSITSKLLSRHPPRVSPSKPQRPSRRPTVSTHRQKLAQAALASIPSIGRFPSLKGGTRRLSAHSRRRRQDVALAVNSQLMRAQDQLHIHIGCISPVARRAIGLVAPDLSDSDWTRLNWHVHGPDVWARRISQSSLDGVNPFRLAEGIRDGDAKLTQIAIVIAGSELADGRDGFVELAWLDDTARPGGSLTADGLLDPSCSR
jgi:CDP-diacylglycerol pyrophosphatase